MKDNASVLVVGSYAVGLVMQTERLPGPGETLIGHGFRAVHGGKGSNQAVQSARLGTPTAFLACVGQDAYGDQCADLHRDEGVDTSLLIRHPELPTGVGFIVVDAAGHNLITLDMGANGALTPEVLAQHADAFGGRAVVLAQMEIPVPTALAAMRHGKELGAITILNPAPAADLSTQDLSSVDYLVPNETELRVSAGLGPDASTDEAVSRLLDRGCANVVVTLGEEGCALFGRDGHRLTMPGFAVQAVDTVGAGDAFCGALATALAERRPIEEALRWANAAAALSVTRQDTVPSYHRRAEVEAFLQAQA